MSDPDEPTMPGWDDPDDTRGVAARRWRPIHVVERVFGIDEYHSIVAGVIGIDTGPVSDLLIDVIFVGTLLFSLLLVVLLRSIH
ncbi:MAG: hypothetical protein ABEJ81_06720 [Haloferacaceae archaeon]